MSRWLAALALVAAVGLLALGGRVIPDRGSSRRSTASPPGGSPTSDAVATSGLPFIGRAARGGPSLKRLERRRDVLAALGAVAAVVLLWLPMAAARAHGPCGCLPADASAGDTVVVDNAFRAVWNPARADVYYAQPALVAAHVDGAPRIVLLDRDRKDARKRARFVVPDVPAGEYLVLLYDGSEGGDHYTWDSVAVRRRPVQAPAGSEATDSSTGRGGFPTGPVVAGLVVLSAAGGLLSVRHRRARHSGVRHE